MLRAAGIEVDTARRPGRARQPLGLPHAHDDRPPAHNPQAGAVDRRQDRAPLGRIEVDHGRGRPRPRPPRPRPQRHDPRRPRHLSRPIRPASTSASPGSKIWSPRRALLTRGEAVEGWEILSSPQDVYRLHDVNDLLVEGGSGAATAFLAADLVDRILIYRAPILVGAGKSSFGYIGLDAIADSHGRWRALDGAQLGVDRLRSVRADAVFDTPLRQLLMVSGVEHSQPAHPGSGLSEVEGRVRSSLPWSIRARR